MLNNTNDDNLIQNKKCIYCKQNVKTCAKIPKCSRKKCKKLRGK